MDWQQHMRRNACNWLLGDRPQGCLGESLLLLFGNPDLFDRDTLCSLLGHLETVGTFLKGSYDGTEVALTTPKFGAPIVAMYLEVAAMAGVRRVLAAGYVGALCEEARVGDLFIPTAAVGLDGTTRAYALTEEQAASPALHAALLRATGERDLAHNEGVIVSIDALMLESTALITEWREAGYSAVDLETACLLAVGGALGLECAAVHIVSDSPFEGDTDPGAAHMASRAEQLTIALDALVSAQHP